MCLGFSILSGVEVIYFLILRAFWKFCRKKAFKKNAQKLQEQKTSSYFHQLLFEKQKSKVITLNPNTIPLYSRELVGQSMWSPNFGMNDVLPVTITKHSLGKTRNGSSTFVPINTKGMTFYTYDY